MIEEFWALASAGHVTECAAKLTADATAHAWEAAIVTHDGGVTSGFGATMGDACRGVMSQMRLIEGLKPAVAV